jgi:hypothetical protein
MKPKMPHEYSRYVKIRNTDNPGYRLFGKETKGDLFCENKIYDGGWKVKWVRLM